MCHSLAPHGDPTTPLASFPLFSDLFTWPLLTKRKPTVREQLFSGGVGRPQQLTEENKGIGKWTLQLKISKIENGSPLNDLNTEEFLNLLKKNLRIFSLMAKIVFNLSQKKMKIFLYVCH